MARNSESSEASYHAVGGFRSDKDHQRLRWPSRKCHPFESGWIWETMAMVASFGCMVAVVTILASMQSKPLSHWKFPIALNAIIAIFITASKSMTLLVIAACIAQSKWILFKSSTRRLLELDIFEDASRGPLGSLRLLSHVRWSSGIASLGAVATIIALGIDTFAQQVVRLDTIDVKVHDGQASFGLSHSYKSGATFYAGSTYDPDRSTTDVSIQVAALQGISGTSTNPSFNCSSRCVWEDTYLSLGFASSCIDATEPTLASNRTDSFGRNENWMTTPGNVSISAPFAPTGYQTKINVVAKDLTLPSMQSKLADRGNFIDVRSSTGPAYLSPDIIRIAIVQSPLGYTGNLELDEYRKSLSVTECNISVVAYEYTQVTAFGNRFNYKINHIPLQPGILQEYNGSVMFNQTGLPIFRIMPVDLLGLSQFFESERFSGMYQTGLYRNLEGKGIGNTLFKRNISQAMEDMARSMTDQLRTGYDETAQGLTVNSVVFVKVRWAWLSLPVGVLVTTALLLVITAVNSQRYECELWKSSAVAVLNHRVVQRSDSTAVLKTDLKNLKEMENLAKQIKVTMERK